MIHIQMKIYLYNLRIFHSSLYCTVPFCPSIYAYIIFTLWESIESLERGSFFFLFLFLFCFLFCGRKNVSWILFCNISDLQCCKCCACLSTLLANNNLGTDYSERLSFFSYENTACRNCKKHLLWHRFTLQQCPLLDLHGHDRYYKHKWAIVVILGSVHCHR